MDHFTVMRFVPERLSESETELDLRLHFLSKLCLKIRVSIELKIFIDKLKQALAGTSASLQCNKREVIYKNTSFLTKIKLNKQGSKLTLANSQNASDFDNLRVRKISTSKRLRVRIIHVSQTKGNKLLVVSPVC